eukprot:m.83614 g.83614  ORF g.83614 m.83614 type:complete len:52 (+) comp8306_c1_seq1:31-186(+)
MSAAPALDAGIPAFDTPAARAMPGAYWWRATIWQLVLHGQPGGGLQPRASC